MFSLAPLHRSFDVIECATAGQRIEQLTSDLAIKSQPDPEAFLTIAHTHWIGEQLKAQHAPSNAAPPHRRRTQLSGGALGTVERFCSFKPCPAPPVDGSSARSHLVQTTHRQQLTDAGVNEHDDVSTIGMNESEVVERG